MESPETLDREDPALSEGVRGVIDRLATGGDHTFFAIPQLELGAADRAGVGLSMKSPVERIPVFTGAGRAHGRVARFVDRRTGGILV